MVPTKVNGFAPRVDWTNPSRPCTVTRVQAELLNDQARVETCCEQTWPKRNCGSKAWHKVDDVLLTRSLSAFYGPWCIVFWATVCKTVRPMLSARCPVCLSCSVLSVCDVGVLWPNGWMIKKLGRGSAPFLGRGGWVPIWHKVAWSEAYLHAKCHLDPSSRLATINIGRKIGGSVLFLGRGSGVPSTKSPRAEAYRYR